MAQHYQGIQRKAHSGGHPSNASDSGPATLKRGEIGEFQAALNATLKRRGMEMSYRGRRKR